MGATRREVQTPDGSTVELDTRSPAVTFVTLACGTVLACEPDGSDVIGASCSIGAGWAKMCNTALAAVRAYARASQPRHTVACNDVNDRSAAERCVCREEMR